MYKGEWQRDLNHGQGVETWTPRRGDRETKTPSRAPKPASLRDELKPTKSAPESTKSAPNQTRTEGTVTKGAAIFAQICANVAKTMD